MKARWESDFDRKCSRMLEGGFGKNASIDGRLIWCVDKNDEDCWEYADESLKSFIRGLIREDDNIRPVRHQVVASR